MRASLALAVVLLTAVPSFAGVPELEDKTFDAISVGVPKGWSIKTQSGNGTQMFMAQRPPGADDSPAVVVTVTPDGATATEDQLVTAILSQLGKSAKVTKRESLQGGGTQVIADGAAGKVPVRLGAVVLARDGHAVTISLIATPADFESLGGMKFVVATLGSIKPAKTAAPANADPKPAKTK
ncbi:MAG: hypothetical protein QM723_25700 [Myxococcaceae bacterium]